MFRWRIRLFHSDTFADGLDRFILTLFCVFNLERLAFIDILYASGSARVQAVARITP